MRKIRITGKGLPRFQQRPGTFIGPLEEQETYGPYPDPDPFPKINLSQFVGCPPGQKVDSVTGNCVPDPKFDESTIQRPASTDPAVNPEYEQAQRDAAIIGRRGESGPMDDNVIVTSAEDLMRMRQKPKTATTRKTRTYNPTAALLTLGTLSKGADILQQADLENRLNKFQRQLGRTDNRFGAVPNIYSRGRTDTGYAYNMMVPVQFAGAPTFEAMISPQFPQAPRFQFGQDGIEVRRDILQMPELYTQMEPSQIDPMFTQTYADVDLSGATPNYSEAPTMTSSAPVVPTGAPLSSRMVMEGLSLPLDPYEFRVGSGFGKRRAPIKGASTDHNGIDLGMRAGANIYSIKPGKVLSAYYNSKGGNQVIIAHDDGTRSGYAHLKDFAIKEGDVVGAGDVIGYVGNTGISTGPHLHFTYRNEKGDLVDPYTLLDWKLYGSNAKGSSKNVVNSTSNAQISFTHNNPLNIHYGDFAKEYGGTKGHVDGDGNVAMFQDFNTGITAARDLLFGPNYRDLTVSQARQRWVGGPSTSIPYIVQAMGGDKRLRDMSIEEKEKLIKQFAKWEGKQAYNLVKDMDLKPYLMNRYEEGGEYDLDEDEIKQILANGGQIEFL
jgi:hypothetical protein